MAFVANVRLQRIWNEDWSKTKKQNNEKLSLRMADKFLSFNHNNIKCKRKTTHQKAVRNGPKCDEWRHRLVSWHAQRDGGGCIFATQSCLKDGANKSPVSQKKWEKIVCRIWRVNRRHFPFTSGEVNSFIFTRFYLQCDLLWKTSMIENVQASKLFVSVVAWNCEFPCGTRTTENWAKSR